MQNNLLSVVLGWLLLHTLKSTFQVFKKVVYKAAFNKVIKATSVLFITVLIVVHCYTSLFLL